MSSKYTKGAQGKYAECVIDDEEDVAGVPPAPSRKICHITKEVDLAIHECLFPADGKPCSAILPNVLPRYFEDPVELSANLLMAFDEYGFRNSDARNAAQKSTSEGKAEELEKRNKEEAENRMKWLAALEFSHDHIKDELRWSMVKADKLSSEKFENMIKENGVPHRMRSFIWYRMGGGLEKEKSAPFTYEDVVRHSASDNPAIGVQIEKDLLRTLPTNVCFYRKTSPGIESLRRVLKGIAYIYPDLGYCQGMGVVVSTLLLFCSEQSTFWLMTSLVEGILPPNYYSTSLLGLQADERVTRHLMSTHVPDLYKVLDDYDVEVSMILINWLITLLASVTPLRVLLRIWDLLFLQGSITLFRTLISLMKMKEEEIMEFASQTRSSADIFNAISQIPQSLSVSDDVRLFEYITSYEFSISEVLIMELRKKYQVR